MAAAPVAAPVAAPAAASVAPVAPVAPVAAPLVIRGGVLGSSTLHSGGGPYVLPS